jgi:hypothetical protein
MDLTVLKNKKPAKQIIFERKQTGNKSCNNCNEVKSVSEFATDKYNNDGLQRKCKTCQSDIAKKINEKNKLKNSLKNAVVAETKKCLGQCRQTKPCDAFWKDKMKPDGLQSICIECRKTAIAKKTSDITETEKECKECCEIKSLDDFHKSKTGEFGRHNICCDCRSAERKSINIPKPTEGTNKCSTCNEIKNVSEFDGDKSNSTGLQSCCKPCNRLKSAKWASTFDGHMTKLFKDLQHNTMKRAKDIKIKITKQDIIDLYHKQNGKCAITKEPLTHTSQVIDTKGRQHIMNKWNVSVDRIDSDKHYTLDNIQLVGAIVNRIKSDLNMRDFYDICGKVFMNMEFSLSK